MLDQYTYLYVEDDALSREIMQVTMQEMLGIQTLTLFEDSYNFMARLAALPRIPDLIMLDVHIAPHSGIEMLHMIRNNPDYAGVKVIALTASVMNEEVRQLKQKGFDGAIGKPIDVLVFPDLITRILNNEAVWHIA